MTFSFSRGARLRCTLLLATATTLTALAGCAPLLVGNELQIAGAASLTSRSNDAIVTSKVKASFVDARDISANYYKVVTERGVVYLMGRVTEAEATRATELARSVPGVQKVVRLFEILSQAEVDAMRLKPQLDETPRPSK